MSLTTLIALIISMATLPLGHLPTPQPIQTVGSPQRGRPSEQRYDYRPAVRGNFHGLYASSTHLAHFAFPDFESWWYYDFGILDFQTMMRVRDPWAYFLRRHLRRTGPFPPVWTKTGPRVYHWDMQF